MLQYFALVVAMVLPMTHSATAPYPASQSPTRQLLAIAETNRTNADLLFLDSLAGNVARISPRLYRVSDQQWTANSTQDSYSLWLQGLAKQGVVVNSSLVSAPLIDILAQVVKEGFKVTGFVRCNVADASTSAAVTLAAAGEGLLVAGDDAVAESLAAAGVSMARDVRGKGMSDVLDEVVSKLSTTIFIFQDPAKSVFLADYAIFARAPYMGYGTDAKAQSTLLERADPASAVGACFGWGPENDYVSTCNAHGLFVHASDYNKNLPALSNAKTATHATPEQRHDTSPAADTHTVAFVMTDGDNLQWTMGPWFIDDKWWGSSKRGSVPLGWTFSPSLAWLAPSVLATVKQTRTPNDELVAGPSGVGYMFPSRWPSSALTAFSELTATGMEAAGMHIINCLGQDDAIPSDASLSPMLSSSQVDGLLYYPWGDGYAGLHGRVASLDHKPVVSGRFSLWGEDTTGDMLGVKGMIAKLLTMPKDPSKPDGYSIIPVHAWSHSYADVVEVATALQKAGGYDIVLPSELLRRVQASVSDTCTCDTPGTGTADHNHYSCTDGSAGYCSASEVCFALQPFDKGQWGDACEVLGPVSCACDTPGQGTAGHNHYSCSDGSDGYCSATQQCLAHIFTKGEWTHACL